LMPPQELGRPKKRRLAPTPALEWEARHARCLQNPKQLSNAAND
jgi:hypothetical protein